MRQLILLPIALCIVMQHGGIVAAQSTREARASRNKAIVEASFKGWQDGTASPFDLLEADATWTIVGHSVVSKTYPDKETFMRDVIRPFNARMSAPLKPEVRGIYADGETVVVLFDAKSTRHDGKPYVNTYAWFLEMKGGRVTGVKAFFDSVAFNELWSGIAPR